MCVRAVACSVVQKDDFRIRSKLTVRYVFADAYMESCGDTRDGVLISAAGDVFDRR